MGFNSAFKVLMEKILNQFHQLSILKTDFLTHLSQCYHFVHS